ncbi:hypothetical protein KFK09_017984 [Dendrobium nobile]|uniref:Uncharacterized protein n=1 Tax=Dendrobium nobile TaxID=94219 RepID=A0A8T3AT29_DENNO|nr:hypothetical protein KFK09_017984 [Dendrobium nobile]
MESMCDPIATMLSTRALILAKRLSAMVSGFRCSGRLSGDRFVVKVRVSGSSAARLFFEHHIFSLPDEKPILEANATAVWLDKSHRPIRLPAEFTSKLLQFDPSREYD